MIATQSIDSEIYDMIERFEPADRRHSTLHQDIENLLERTDDESRRELRRLQVREKEICLD